MSQANHIHNRKITTTDDQVKNLAEVGKLEDKLFEMIGKLHKAQELKDEESQNFWNTRINSLTKQYAWYCAV